MTIRLLYSIITLALAAALFALPEGAKAQACPPGQRIIGMTPAGNGVARAPICAADGSQQQAPRPAPPPPDINEVYQKMRDAGVSPPDCDSMFNGPWGAIYESADGEVHQAHCKASQQDAVRWALKHCQRYNRGTCRAVFAGRKQVVAITRHANRNFIAANSNGKKAIGEAQAQCRQAAGGECRIWYLYDARKGQLSSTTRF